MGRPLKDCARNVAAIVLPLLLLSACATAIGPRISAEEEKRAQAALLAEAQAWRHREEQRIRRVATRLMRAAENPSPLDFHLLPRIEQSGGRIHPDSINAWTDGRTVWVTRGLLRFLRNDDELAIVLAHEVAHAFKGHLTSQRAKQLVRLAMGPAAGIGMLVVNAATNKFDRDREREADLYGLIWASRAGFDVEAASDLLKRMAIEAPESLKHGFLSVHPTSAERLLAMEQVIETLKSGSDPLKVFAAGEEAKKERTRRR